MTGRNGNRNQVSQQAVPSATLSLMHSCKEKDTGALAGILALKAHRKEGEFVLFKGTQMQRAVLSHRDVGIHSTLWP